MGLSFLLGTIVLASILGPVAGRFISRPPKVSLSLLAAFVAPALLLLATTYAYGLGSTGEAEKVAVFGVFFAIVSLLIDLLTSAVVIFIKLDRAEGNLQPQHLVQTERLRARMTSSAWVAAVVALAAALVAVVA